MNEVMNIPKEPESELVIKFGKPFVFEGKTYTEVDLRGIESLSGYDLCNADRALRAQGSTAPMTELTPDMACFLGGIAAHLPIEFFKALPIKEMIKVKNAVVGFIFGGDE